MARWIAAVVALTLVSTTAFAFTISRETATTADGVTLVMKHYAGSGPPVILCHGIVQNDACMDLPVAGSSLAKYLAARGYDVWVANLRSHGKGFFKSGSTGKWDWSIDEFAAYDVPALVDTVRARTGQKPFWIGHSMGGMSAYGYLQGTTIRSVKVDEVWGWTWCGWWLCYKKLYDVYADRVVADPTLAASRNSDLRGLVTIASPVKLKWLYSVSIWNYWLYNYWDYNLIVSQLAASNAANNALRSMDYIPLGTLAGYLTGDIRNLPYIGGVLYDFLQWVFGAVGSSFLTAQVWYPPDMTPAIAQSVIDYTLDDTESKVALQFLDGVRKKTWRDFHVDDPMRDPYVYADHYSRVTTPLLMIAGNRDKMCNDNVAYYEGFSQMGSADRTWRDFAAFGHDDLVVGDQADDQVYPFILNWLKAR